MIIDIHAHCYRKTFFQMPGREPWPTPETLLPRYDKMGVDKAVIQLLIGPEFYLPTTNEDALEIAEKYPDRFIPFCNIHPQAISNSPFTKLELVLEQYKAAGCKGVGEVICNKHFLDPLMQNFFRAVESTGMPMTIHVGHRVGDIYGIVDEPGLPELEETLARYPKLRILGHAMAFWAEIGPLETVYARSGYPKGKITEEGALPKIMRRHPNLYGDLSAGSGANSLMRDPDFAAKFMDEFQDRLCFGIDICSAYVHPADTWLLDFMHKMLAEKRISQEIYDKIMYKNAVQILGL
ncbi:MAG: amidohydrolase family protein [Victivallales bacterium]|nr:amidohydrolase family protein [Victivallales bacterium]